MNYIHEFVESHGFEPSYQQIANSIGVKSKGGIAKHIEALEKKGLLSRNNINGSFHLELNPQKTVSELVCEVEWMHSDQNTHRKYEDENLYIPKFMLGYLSSSNLRALTIDDNAMIDEHICEDDIALFETKTFARDGEIVVTLIRDRDILVRKFYRDGSDIRLAAANENFDELKLPADKIKIIGIFRGILRPFS